MESLEFEKVSISDVRREIDGQHKRNEEGKCAPPERAPHGSAVLLDETSRWIAALPANVRPLALARKLPRIANSIAELWRRVASCGKFLDTLVVDVRGDRSGFPADVAQELMALRNYYTVLHPQQVRLGISWRGRIARLSRSRRNVARANRHFASFCLSLLFSRRRWRAQRHCHAVRRAAWRSC